MAFAAIAAVASLASGVVGMMGAKAQADAEAAALEYNAKVKQRNANMVQQQADAAARDATRENYRKLGGMRAMIGASGLGLAGSPLDALEDSAAEMAYDTAKIRYRGKVQAQELKDGAMLDRMGAQAAKSAGRINAASALFNGVTSAASTMSSAGSSLART